MANKNTYLKKVFIKSYEFSLNSTLYSNTNKFYFHCFIKPYHKMTRCNIEQYNTSNLNKLSVNKSSSSIYYKTKINLFCSLKNKNENFNKDAQLNISNNTQIEMFSVSNDKELNYDIKNIEKIGSKSKKDLQPAFTISNPEINTKYTPDAVKNYSLKIVNTSEIDEIHHDEEIKGTYYKYGLPLKNEIYKPHQAYLQELKQNEKEQALTATENMMELFELNKDSSYESLVLKYNQNFNNGK